MNVSSRGSSSPATPTVALVGGGVSVSALIDELASTLSTESLRLRLVAQDHDRVRSLVEHGRHLVARRPGWRVDPCRSMAEAVDGATVVVLMLRVGGLDARRRDEILAQRFGLPGDEGLGPGGAANALRTLPVVDQHAADLARLAPDATVLNLVAPLGLTTRVLLDRGVHTIGVCELPGETEQALGSVLEEGAPLAYAGFNHLGWFWPVGLHGEPSTDPVGVLEPAVRAGLVDRSVLERYEAVPLKYYYWLHEPDAAARLGISRDPDRSAVLLDLRDRARADLVARPDRRSAAVSSRPTPWFRDAVAPMLEALLGGSPWRGYANVRNDGLAPAFAPDLVVEVPVHLDASGVTPRPVPASMPPVALRFSHHVERSEHLLHAAWREADLALVEQSFVEGPHLLEQPVARHLAQAIATATGFADPGADKAALLPGRPGASPVHHVRFETRPTTATEYLVGPGAWSDDRLTAVLRDRPLVAVIDDEVARLHGTAIEGLLGEVDCITRVGIRGGERCKTQAQLDSLLATFEGCALPKHGAVVAIGGGTVSDVVGVASVLMRRSVPLVLLPTTLLAQVDAAVGGKNGINSPTSKNMIGHFHHPLVVASDPRLLRTLDARQLVGGIAECIKVFAVGDGDGLRRHLPTLADQDRAGLADWTALVADAQDVKLRLLIDDPFESSSQRLLNYGHAFAHLLEEQSGFELLHGEAVLLGMLIENEVSRVLELATDAVDDLQDLIVDLVPAPAHAHWVPFEVIGPDIEKVRQMRRAAMNLVCVRVPGDAVIVDDLADDLLSVAWRRAEERLRASSTVARSTRSDRVAT